MFPFSKFNNWSGFNPPCTEKPLQLCTQTRNLMECAWCSSEQLPALDAVSHWGQLCRLGLWDTRTWALLPSASRERKGKEGRRKAKKNYSVFHQVKHMEKAFRLQAEKSWKFWKSWKFLKGWILNNYGACIKIVFIYKASTGTVLYVI